MSSSNGPDYVSRGERLEGSIYKVRTLPDRYEESPRDAFLARFSGALQPGAVVLDVGGGRSPCLAPSDRPPGCVYAGLDASRDELLAAPQGSYDEIWPGMIEMYRPELENRFDLAISWQVLEHVKSMRQSLANLRRYLRPGGLFVAQLSGRFSVVALLNAIVPRRVGTFAMEKLLSRPPESVFPAYYDQCWYSALVRLGSDWSSFEVTPRYCNAIYFNFSKTLQQAYLLLENRLASGGRHNLAPHYLVAGTR